MYLLDNYTLVQVIRLSIVYVHNYKVKMHFYNAFAIIAPFFYLPTFFIIKIVHLFTLHCLNI
jgi:hypothetical protein